MRTLSIASLLLSTLACAAGHDVSLPGGRPSLSRDLRVRTTDKGWTVRYTTELTEEVWYYLRGEEYSAQIDHFVKSIQARRLDGENTFRSALQTDRIVAMILAEGVAAAPAATLAVPTRRQGWRTKLFG